MPWGTIRDYDAKKAAAAQKLPATQAEMHEWFPWELHSRIAYNLHDEAKLDDDKSINASDFAKIQAYAATAKNPNFDDEYARAASSVVLDVYPALKRATGKSTFTYDEIIAAAEKKNNALWKQVDTHDPKTLSKKEVDLIEKKNAGIGFFAREASEHASFNRGSDRGYTEHPDPRVNKLKTANDYLKYNLQGVVDEESDSPSKKIELKDVPKEQHAAVKSAIEMLGKRIDDLEKDTAKEDWKGGDITGIYAVHRSPTDKTPVGYVVTARADYDYDGWTEWNVAVSLNGKTIVDQENTGP